MQPEVLAATQGWPGGHGEERERSGVGSQGETYSVGRPEHIEMVTSPWRRNGGREHRNPRGPG